MRNLGPTDPLDSPDVAFDDVLQALVDPDYLFEALYGRFPNPAPRLGHLRRLRSYLRGADFAARLRVEGVRLVDGDLERLTARVADECSRTGESLRREREIERHDREAFRADQGGDGASIDDYRCDLRPIAIRPRAQARRRRETGGRKSGSSSRGTSSAGPGDGESDPEPPPRGPRPSPVGSRPWRRADGDLAHVCQALRAAGLPASCSSCERGSA